MAVSFAYTIILGLPMIAWGGIVTLILLATTAMVGFLSMNGIVRIDVKWHIALAIVTVLLAMFHGTLGLLAYL